MKNNKIQMIGSIVIIGILVLIMADSIIFTLTPKVLNKIHLTNDKINEFFQINNRTVDNINIDYSKIYPFKNSEDQKENTKNIVQKYLSVVDLVKEKLEENTSKSLFGYEDFVELSYIYNKAIGYNIVSNSSDARIEITDGYYTQLRQKNYMNNIVAEKVIEFNNYLKSENIDYLYVYAPSKVSKNQNFSSIYNDYTNENGDVLLSLLKDKVDYIDLRQNMEENGFDQLKLYFKTDHHWLPETGLWATNEISNYINKQYQMNLEIQNLDKDKYNFKVYPKMFLGSDGRYVTLANAKPEDFTLITPKFDTKLNIKIGEDLNKTGSFQETVIDWNLVKYGNYYKLNQYNAYMHGDRPLIEIENKKLNNNKKILLLKDSFGDVVSPFLSLETEYLSIIDLRYFNGSLKTYIEEFKPDMVVTLYSGLTISNYYDKSIDNHYLIDRLNK